MPIQVITEKLTLIFNNKIMFISIRAIETMK